MISTMEVLLLLTSVILCCLLTGAQEQENTTLSLLQRFNFVPQALEEYGRPATENEVTQAVKDLQFMAGLEETGLINDETLNRIESRRCGILDDVAARRAGKINRPSKAFPQNRELTWAVVQYSDPSKYTIPSDDPVTETRRIIKDAFDQWEEQTSLSFIELIGELDVLSGADIRIMFVENYNGQHKYHEDNIPFDGEGGDVAHAFSFREFNGGQIHLDERENWSLIRHAGNGPVATVDESEVSLYAVMVHEIGHVLGLQHSNNPDSVMYPWYRGDASLPQVFTAEDQETIQKLLAVTTEENPQPSNDSMNLVYEGMECPPSIDAAVIIQSKAFFFKDNLYWMMNAQREIVERGVKIHRFWYGLPEDLSSLDAVYYERSYPPVTYFFTGKTHFKFSSNTLDPKRATPYRNVDICLPFSLDKVDAAFTWGHNQEDYIISDDMYWRVSAVEGTRCQPNLESMGYPKRVETVWRGVPVPVDAAMTYFDDKTYFFSGSNYYVFNNTAMHVEDGYPKPISELLQCTPPKETFPGKQNGTNDGDRNGAIAYSIIHDKLYSISVSIILTLCMYLNS